MKTVKSHDPAPQEKPIYIGVSPISNVSPDVDVRSEAAARSHHCGGGIKWRTENARLLNKHRLAGPRLINTRCVIRFKVDAYSVRTQPNSTLRGRGLLMMIVRRASVAHSHLYPLCSIFVKYLFIYSTHILSVFMPETAININ